VRAAITTLLDNAEQHRCGAVVVANLDFADARATGREPSAADNAARSCAAPWRVSPPAGSAPG
jgi:hypothetical protein